MSRLVLLSKLYDPGRQMLPDDLEVVEAYTDFPEDMMDVLYEADIILLGNQKFPKEMIDRLPHLKAIAKQGSGYDNIDVKAASDRGIPVILSAGANAYSVAEHVIMMVLAANKNLHRYESAVRNGEFGIRSRCFAKEVGGTKLGLVGCGNIGMATGYLAKGLNMDVLAYDPCLTEEEIKKSGFQYCETFEQLLMESDTVSVHVPLNEKTRGMIGKAEIRKMKDGAVLINCSRGGIVREDALYDALVCGKLSAAGIDVYEQEPVMADHPLFTLDNVTATPHSAALTQDAAAVMSTMTVKGILDILHGKPCEKAANPEVFEKTGL